MGTGRFINNADGTVIYEVDGVQVSRSKMKKKPTGAINITSTDSVDVSEYAVAQVADIDLKPENIKKDINILGVEGSLDTSGPRMYGEYLVRVVDYDAKIIKQEWLNPGDVFTMPEPPVHNNLTFDGWSSPVAITNNTVTVVDNDINIGPMWYTTDGKVEEDVYVPAKTTMYKISNATLVDWGDGTIDSQTSHAYATAGYYTVKSTVPDNYTHYSSSMTKYAKSIRLPRQITSLGSFSSTGNGYQIESIQIPKNVTTFGRFDSCKLLKALILPTSMTVVPGYSIYSLPSLKYLVIPNSVTDLGQTFTLNYCGALESVTIPTSVTKLYRLEQCQSLNKLVIPSSITEGTSAPAFCFNGGMSSMTKYVDNRDLSNCDDIWLFGMGGASKLKELKFIYSNKYNHISNPSFANMNSLEKIELPATFTEITQYMFQYDSSLTDIIFLGDITTIGGSPFQYCYALSRVDFRYCTTVPSISYRIDSYNGITKIVVPDALYNDWIAASTWSSMASKIIKASDYDAL